MSSVRTAVVGLLALLPAVAEAGIAAASAAKESGPLGFTEDTRTCEGVAAQPGRIRALVFGVDRTADVKLAGAVGDARRLGGAIKRRSASALVMVLENPKRDVMVSALRVLVESVGCRDFVWVHFSGSEGVYASEQLRRDDLVLVASDGSNVRAGNAALAEEQGIRGKDLASAVTAMRNRGAFVLVSLDTCRAGVLSLREVAAESAWRLSRGGGRLESRLLPGAEGMASFLAADAKGVAPERKVGTEVYGVFSFALAGGLDAGLSTVRALADHVAVAVGSESTPVIESTEPDRALLVPGAERDRRDAVAATAGKIRLIRPAPSKGLSFPAAQDVEVEAEAIDADRLVIAQVNEATATLDGRRLAARIKLAPGTRRITINAQDARGRAFVGSFDIEVVESSAVNRGRDVAILIGNARYEDSQRWRDLPFPEAEVRELQQVLQTRYGFRASFIANDVGLELPLLLVNSDKKTIITTIEKVSRTLAPEDQLLIYFSGHGWKPQKIGEAFWVPRDAEGEMVSTYISPDEIAKAFGESNVGHVLVIADSCRSGTMWGATKAEAPHGPHPEDPGYAAGVMRFYSKRPSRFAFTSGADEDVPSARIFSEWLLKYLKDPENVAFLGSELASWMKPRVAGDPRVGGTGQVPQYFLIPKAGYGGGDFAFFQTAQRR